MRTRSRTGAVRVAHTRAARSAMAWALLNGCTITRYRLVMNKLDLLRRALSALFSARFIELQRAVRRR
ncbi:hypothetical protein WT21_14775 [Burkholderia territorii]|uniref:hypothetical protein n=1 Tax=Burkholderia territorii TaxID=1503055 RepID=UPI00075A7B4B|nr:hypothetical protein [Burkholderia territorii]AOI67243.1 hypothetical protein WS51_26350 [Burkholderia territorii]KUZ15872.1 hypothetical protein WS50_15850 [Burkholderia territorii]KUZ50598.1 hypothetical protein WS53_21335 [Burkholderia territorii]KVG57379.1 hypothetical protein WS79_17785 [Burkholderia territorii]KVL03734.1 hypothetical protein WS94_00025 [Burkholderia territorii]